MNDAAPNPHTTTPAYKFTQKKNEVDIVIDMQVACGMGVVFWLGDQGAFMSEQPVHPNCIIQARKRIGAVLHPRRRAPCQYPPLTRLPRPRTQFEVVDTTPDITPAKARPPTPAAKPAAPQPALAPAAVPPPPTRPPPQAAPPATPQAVPAKPPAPQPAAASRRFARCPTGRGAARSSPWPAGRAHPHPRSAASCS